MIRRELLSMKKIILTAAVCLGGYVSSQGQVSLTIEKAMDIAEEHSPSLRRSHMNLERYQQNLVAQRASLKSKFSLNLNPVDYSKSRSFDNRLSQWYTNERFSGIRMRGSVRLEHSRWINRSCGRMVFSH